MIFTEGPKPKSCEDGATAFKPHLSRVMAASAVQQESAWAK